MTVTWTPTCLLITSFILGLRFCAFETQTLGQCAGSPLHHLQYNHSEGIYFNCKAACESHTSPQCEYFCYNHNSPDCYLYDTCYEGHPSTVISCFSRQALKCMRTDNDISLVWLPYTNDLELYPESLTHNFTCTNYMMFDDGEYMKLFTCDIEGSWTDDQGRFLNDVQCIELDCINKAERTTLAVWPQYAEGKSWYANGSTYDFYCESNAAFIDGDYRKPLLCKYGQWYDNNILVNAVDMTCTRSKRINLWRESPANVTRHGTLVKVSSRRECFLLASADLTCDGVFYSDSGSCALRSRVGGGQQLSQNKIWKYYN